MAPDARKSAIWLEPTASNMQNAVESPEKLHNLKQRMSTLPPQLRASMFFENPSSLTDVQIRDKSAVATLDDLLDASTTAPVNAFTDHPFAGKVGRQVYKKEPETKRQSTMPELHIEKKDKRQSIIPDLHVEKKEKRRSSFLGFRRMSMSSTDLLGEDSKPKKRTSRAFSLGAKLDDTALARDATGNITGAESDAGTATPEPEGEEEASGGLEQVKETEEDEDDGFVHHGPPTTLLAELQLRKEAQKSRNRPALSSFPNGMHSTLLELDAVAQIQKKKRQTARVTLAWEDPDQIKAKGKRPVEDEEDVPLGVLYATKGKVKAHLKERGMGDWDRPLGLIELREREENEPLSHRRARLKGVDPYAPLVPNPQNLVYDTPLIQIHEEEAIEDEDEPEETLADRLRRLKSQKELDEVLGEENVRVISQAFNENFKLGEDSPAGGLSPAGGSKGNLTPSQAASLEEEEEEEETLGQRRARLQNLAQQQSMLALQPDAQTSTPQLSRPTMTARRTSSFADLLHNVPLGATRKVSDKDLMTSLPQDSLLKQSEEMRAARKENLAQSQAAYTARPLMNNMPGGSMGQAWPARNSMAFAGGAYNNGFGGTPPLRPSMMDLRQSSYGFGAQNQQGMNMYGGNMMGYQNQNPYAAAGMMNMNMNMGMGMSMGMGMPMMPSSNSLPMYNNPATSTPNLLVADMSSLQQQQFQRHSSLMGMPLAQKSHLAEAYLDPNGRARIDAWRQSVQMD